MVQDLFGWDENRQPTRVPQPEERRNDIGDNEGRFMVAQVIKALSGTSNSSAPGPDGVSYKLLKAIKDTRLGKDVVEEVATNLIRGKIPDRWKEMRVVLIPKPGRDLTKTKSWRPINLINFIGKLGEKVVADELQEAELLHRGQFGGVKGRSALEGVFKAVTKARRCMESGGKVGWGFWDVSGGFQNVILVQVLERIDKTAIGRKWKRWASEFMKERSFKGSWDGVDRGEGKTNVGVLQGSPLSPVIFLIWMAPILEEMEKRIKWELGVDIDLPSYVDDIHLGIYDWKNRGTRMEETGEDDNDAEELMDRGNRVLKEVAEERGLPLEESKEERLILKVGRKKGTGKETKWIKWLGIIPDDQLEFDIPWKARIEKARKMLGALNRIENSQWEISHLSWRSAYTGMIRTIATWGAEIGWRGQIGWKKEMARLQYASLRKATGAVLGSRMTMVERIAGVEPVEIHLDAFQARFARRGIAYPTVVGESLALGMNNQHPGSLEAGIMQKALGDGGGEPSWGGKCPQITMKVIDLECNEKNSKEECYGAATAKVTKVTKLTIAIITSSG